MKREGVSGEEEQEVVEMGLPVRCKVVVVTVSW